MCIPSQITCNCYSKVFNAFNVFKVSSLQGIWSMDLIDPFPCQLHHISFDRLKSHTLRPCPGAQSINIPLKSYFRLNIWWDVIYVQREQQRTKNGALGDTGQNRSHTIYNKWLLPEAKKRIYPFQGLATNSIAKRFAFKEFMSSKSNMNVSTCPLLSKILSKSFITVVSWVSQLYPFLNACRLSDRSVCTPRWAMIFEHTMCSSNLQGTQVKETG